MCTVSWIHADLGYELFCNRDEKRTRMPAAPPHLAVRDGVQYLAPVDGDFGGTWIATNEFGVTLALLNGLPSPASRSRGLLVLDLIAQPGTQRVADRIRELDLSLYAPFTLASLEPGKPAAVIEWDRTDASVAFREGRHGMLTSSSFDSGRVREKRRQDYLNLTKEGCTSDLLFAFHLSHGAGLTAEPSAYSVCMHRPDAETVSFSRIRVAESESEFTYVAKAPCSASTTNTSRFKIVRTAPVR